LHLLAGALVVAFIYPWIGRPRRQALKQAWSRQLLSILGIHLKLHGESLPSGSLLVANHISWIDIFVINAARPAAFVSKAEVRHWPLIGWLAAHTDTIFLRRGSRGHARIINEEIATVLHRGDFVALFPEGTTTDGGTLLHFHGALLQPAIAAQCPIVPLALSYHDRRGRRSTAPAYVGDDSLWDCLRAILAAGWLEARLEVTSPLETGNAAHRREIAETAQNQIGEILLWSGDRPEAPPMQEAA